MVGLGTQGHTKLGKWISYAYYGVKLSLIFLYTKYQIQGKIIIPKACSITQGQTC